MCYSFLLGSNENGTLVKADEPKKKLSIGITPLVCPRFSCTKPIDQKLSTFERKANTTHNTNLFSGRRKVLFRNPHPPLP